MLQIAPSGYWRHAAHQRNHQLRCPRAQRDDTLVPHIERVWQANMRVYSADKIWKQMNREGLSIARCTVERLMKRLGLQGVRRGKVVRTTISDTKAPCPLDRVNRVFKAERTNQLWVSDFTYVSTWQGWLYVAGASWAGGSAVPCTQTLFWMPWSRRCMPGNPSVMAP